MAVQTLCSEGNGLTMFYKDLDIHISWEKALLESNTCMEAMDKAVIGNPKQAHHGCPNMPKFLTNQIFYFMEIKGGRILSSFGFTQEIIHLF